VRQYPADALEGLEDRFLISIDHHTRASFAHVNWIDPHATATAELVYCLGRAAGVKITAEIATCLYTGLMTDTGSFMFKGTNEHTFALARGARSGWADPFQCARNIYFAHSTAKMRVLGAALTNLHREGPLAWIWVSASRWNAARPKRKTAKDRELRTFDSGCRGRRILP